MGHPGKEFDKPRGKRSVVSRKKNIILIGPVYARGGIASVIQTMLGEEALSSRCVIELIHTSDGQEGRFVRQCYLALRGLARLGRLSVAKDIDVVHIHASFGSSFYRKLLFFWLAKMLRNKTIFHIHSSKFEFYYDNRNPITRRLIGHVLKKSDAAVVLADVWKRQLLESFPAVDPANVVVLRNPIALSTMAVSHDRPESGTRTVLFLGLLIPTKGLSDLVQAAETVGKRALNVHFAICGEGPERQNLQRLIDEMGLSETVSLVGWVEDSAKTTWLTESYIFVLPSYKEGMPVAILEAMAFGLPVVSTRIAAIPEIIQEGKEGFLVEPGDIEGLSDRVIRLLEDKELWRAMSVNAQQKVKEYSATRIADQWIHLYDSLTDKPV
jgi:glycosyltransferase involved in cell wall biosynthesis